MKNAGQYPVYSKHSANALLELGRVGAFWPFWFANDFEGSSGEAWSCPYWESRDHSGFWVWVLEWENHCRGKGMPLQLMRTQEWGEVKPVARGPFIDCPI